MKCSHGQVVRLQAELRDLTKSGGPKEQIAKVESKLKACAAGMRGGLGGARRRKRKSRKAKAGS